jgi:hypothetical protein
VVAVAVAAVALAAAAVVSAVYKKTKFYKGTIKKKLEMYVLFRGSFLMQKSRILYSRDDCGA